MVAVGVWCKTEDVRSERVTQTDWELLARQPLNYTDIGATAHPRLPDGFHHFRRRELLGNGPQLFGAAATALSNWDMHRGAGLRVQASGPAAPGAVVLLGLGPLRATCRVVYAVNEPDRRGFAYGTVQDRHPESGEEYFGIYRDPADGRVFAEIVAFSRPARWWSKLGAAVAGKVQSHITDRYVQALKSLANPQVRKTASR